MNTKERVKEVIIRKGGIAKSADFVSAGIRAVDVVNLCNIGFLSRVRHGYYKFAEKNWFPKNSLLRHLFPKELYVLNQPFFIMVTVIFLRASGQ